MQAEDAGEVTESKVAAANLVGREDSNRPSAATPARIKENHVDQDERRSNDNEQQPLTKAGKSERSPQKSEPPVRVDSELHEINQ